MKRPSTTVVTAALTSAAFILGFLAGSCAPPAHADSWAYVDPDDNTEIMQTFANVLADVEAQYHTGPLEVTTGWVGGENVFAQANSSGITVNKAWSTVSYAQMDAAVQSDVAVGFHNGGCDGVHTIALHEVAHVIDQRRSSIGSRRAEAAVGDLPRPDLRGVLSAYSFNPATGAVDPGEAVAEAFQAVVCGSATAWDQALYDMLVN